MQAKYEPSLFKSEEESITLKWGKGTMTFVKSKERTSDGKEIYTTPGSSVPHIPTGEMYLVFKKDTDSSVIDNAFTQMALGVVEQRSSVKFIVRSENPVVQAKCLQQLDFVDVAEPDMITPVTYGMPCSI